MCYMREEKNPKFECPKINNWPRYGHIIIYKVLKNGIKVKMFNFSHFNNLYPHCALKITQVFFFKTDSIII